MTKVTDEKYMAEALDLAGQGEGLVAPNPLVGAVLAKDGNIIGRGFHQKYGGPHAEVRAIEDAKKEGKEGLVKGATLYVTLEPCCHTDKQTPPCVVAIVKNGIKRVVIAQRDPNPKVSGKGVEQLRQAGIDVVEGVLEGEADKLNSIYNKFINTALPYIHLKLAQTLDGKIATFSGDSKWISDESARRWGHQLRFKYDAVFIGRRTLNQDNPALDIRLVEAKGKKPWRVVLGNPGKMNLRAKILSDEYIHKTVVLTSLAMWQASPLKVKEFFKERKILVIREDDLEKKLRRLGELKITSIFVEGGGKVFSSFVEENLYDKLSLVICPILLGMGVGNFTTGRTASLVKRVDQGLHLGKGTFEKLDRQVIFTFESE